MALQIFFNNKLSLSYIKNCFFMKLTSIFATESKNYKTNQTMISNQLHHHHFHYCSQAMC
ncbi:hypothetical protein J2Y38_003746 [Flavobacterium sp. 2755]|nr:hypothetical protein [Flavobacterium sp. 2755]